MTKSEFVSAVAKHENTTKKNAEMMVDAVFETMVEQLQIEEKIQITGFGTFEVTERSAREGRNPASGESVSVDSMKSVKFRASRLFKEMLNGEEV